AAAVPDLGEGERAGVLAEVESNCGAPRGGTANDALEEASLAGAGIVGGNYMPPRSVPVFGERGRPGAADSGAGGRAHARDGLQPSEVRRVGVGHMQERPACAVPPLGVRDEYAVGIRVAADRHAVM